MRIVLAKIYPENDEPLCDLYYRIRENTDKLKWKHGDSSIIIEQDTEDNCLIFKSLILGESAN